MRLSPLRHRWDLSPREAMRLQARLARRVRCEPINGRLRIVAGGDAAFTPDGGSIVAGWVAWDAATGDVIESVLEKLRVTFPYVPGLLSFREAPALLAAAKRLTCEPDVFLLDGQGLAHPRRLGIACHVGLWLGRPTVGCAKSRLCGTHAEPGPRRGASTRLTLDGETIGRVVRTRAGARPVYVSVGHLATLDDAVRLTLSCGRGCRLPEPARLAHQLVSAQKGRLGSPDS